jgi:hypothetical protein
MYRMFVLRKPARYYGLMLWIALLGLLTAFSGWYHPGCLVAAAGADTENYIPAPPGLPCPHRRLRPVTHLRIPLRARQGATFA